MDELLKTAVAQAPGLCVLALVVYWFLGHMKGRDELLKELHHEHMLARNDSRDALRETARAVKDNTEALLEMKNVIRTCKVKND